MFLDILMPGRIDGMETLQQIKRLSAEIEVIIITGSADGPEYMKEAEELGAYDFLPKPLSLDVILEKVEQVDQELTVRCSMRPAGFILQKTPNNLHGIPRTSMQNVW